MGSINRGRIIHPNLAYNGRNKLMSLKENQEYLEDIYEKFAEGTADEKEVIIEELKVNGFIDEAGELEAEIEERALWDKGSEDGVDKWQDKE